MQISISNAIGGGGGAKGGGAPSFSNVNSFSFDGVDDYFIVPDTSGLSFGNGTTDSPFSISAWVKIGQTTAQGIVTKYGSSSRTREYTFYTTGGKLRLLLWGNGTNNFATGTTTFTTDTWYHVACTYDGRGGSTAYNGITLYINGVAESVTTSGGSYTAMSNTSQPLYIGKENAKLIDGNIDETAIFTTELSASDISAIYNNGEPQSLDAYSPFVWFRMGDNATWNGFAWTMTSVGTDTRIARSANMVEANRTTDVPPNPFANTQSILLDGVDDYVSVANNTTIARTQTISYSIWVNLVDGSARQYIIGNQKSSNGGTGLSIESGGFLLFQVADGTNDSYFNSKVTNFTTYAPNNTWNHILATFDGANAKIFINGILRNNWSVTTPYTISNYSDFWIGRRNANTSQLTNGKLDEIALFNTDQSANASAIYNGGVPNDLASLSPLSWWRFEGSGTTAIDSGSGGNNGTLTNGVTRSTDVPT